MPGGNFSKSTFYPKKERRTNCELRNAKENRIIYRLGSQTARPGSVLGSVDVKYIMPTGMTS